MSIVRATHRFPVLNGTGYEGMVEHIKAEVRQRFAGELVKALAEHGGIVGPVHEEESAMDDWLWNSDTKTVTYTVYAYVTDLPEPESYRLMGGPADGRIARTGGVREFVVPFLPPVSVADPFDSQELPVPRAAHYERQGDTAVYLFRSIR